jgi:2-phospho-L-lactate guanylyltransferase
MPAFDIWAVVPVKETFAAKQRLADFVPRELRPGLALAMFEDVLRALAASPGLAGIAVITVDPEAARLAARYGVRIIGVNATGGHTAVIAAAARLLASEGRGGMLQIPGDVPLVTADEVSQLLMSHREPPAFTIAPSHDEMGSNAVLVSPPGAVPLTFGDNSFFPHLDAARERVIEPSVVRLPGIARDIDNPDDLREFARMASSTVTQAFLDRNGFPQWR